MDEGLIKQDVDMDGQVEALEQDTEGKGARAFGDDGVHA